MRNPSLLLSMLVTLCACGGSDDPPESDTGADGSGSSAGTADDDGADGMDDGDTGSGVVGDVTYYADVKPIVDARCGTCHDAGGVAPFPLTNYAEVAAYAEVLAPAVQARTMPPWPADSTCREYRHDASLTDDQIDVLQAWVDQGKAEGDAASEGAPLASADVTLDRIDFVVGMTEGHVPTPDDGIDEHRCFLLDWPAEEPMYITGFETHPGNRAALHHFVGLIVPPAKVPDMQDADEADPDYGWACGAGTGMGGLGSELFATWVPGARATKLPEGTGQLVQPGSKLLLNMHYNVLAGDLSPDQTTFDFQVESAVENPGKMYFATDFAWPAGQTMDIPAGEASVVHESAVSTAQLGSGDYTIHVAGLHMHTLGTSARLFVERASGEQDCLVDIPHWDFDWQLGYDLMEPMHVGAGDELHIECEWDNSAANQPAPDGTPLAPRDVDWGEDTYDEMCLGLIFVTNG